MLSSRWILALICACGDQVRAPTGGALFSEVVVDTAPGLSGLASDSTGTLWTVAERDRHAYRLEPGNGSYRITPYEVVGVPDGIDVEAIALLSPGRFALGGEGRFSPSALVLYAELAGDRMLVTEVIDLPEAALGLRLLPNAGSEGICGFEDTLLVAIESTVEDHGERWSPVIEIEKHAVGKMHKVWLTTRTGKLSALECRRASDGIDVLAIERHFHETKIVTFTIHPETTDIRPTELLDLGPVLQSRLNLEGITWLPDGSLAAVNDNAYRGVTGPSEVIVIPAARVRGRHGKR